MKFQIFNPFVKKEKEDDFAMKMVVDAVKNKYETRFLIHCIFLAVLFFVTSAIQSVVSESDTITMFGFTLAAKTFLSTVNIMLIVALIVGEIEDRMFAILAAKKSWFLLLCTSLMLVLINHYIIVLYSISSETLAKTISFTMFDKKFDICLDFAIPILLTVHSISLAFNLIKSYWKWNQWRKQQTLTETQETSQEKEFEKENILFH